MKLFMKKKAFQSEKQNLENNIKLLKENNLTTDEKITLLESVVCDLFESLLTLQEVNTNA